MNYLGELDYVELNKFSNLHDGKKIFFCKTDYLENEFKKISKFKHEVILISGNSDLAVDEKIVTKMPNNILKWYCQNNQFFHDKLIPIPLGLENTVSNKRLRHGVSWPHASQKVKILKEINKDISPSEASKLVYANFNVKTNPKYRIPLMNYAKASNHIRWEEPNLSYSDFISRAKMYNAVLCPAGNGLDTHRLYEIMYSNLIPITLKTGNYPIYSHLYEHLPIVIIDSVSELENIDTIHQLILQAKEKTSKLELIDYRYWASIILNEKSTLPIHSSFYNKVLDFLKKNNRYCY